MPQFAWAMARVAARRARFSTHLLEVNRMELSLRVVAWLLEMARSHHEVGRNQVTVPARLTQSDLAEMVGASREHVNKAVSSLRAQGIVSFSTTQRLTIHDMARLQQMLDTFTPPPA